MDQRINYCSFCGCDVPGGMFVHPVCEQQSRQQLGGPESSAWFTGGNSTNDPYERWLSVLPDPVRDGVATLCGVCGSQCPSGLSAHPQCEEQLRRYQEAGYSDEESRAWLRDQVSRDDAVPDPVRDGVATLCGVCGSQCPSGLSAHPQCEEQLRRYQEAGYSDEESRAWLRDQVSRDDAVPDPVRDGVATLCGVCGSQCPSGLSAHPQCEEQLRRYQEAGYSDEESRAWLRDQVSRDDAVPDPVRDGVATLCGVCGSQCPSGLSAHPQCEEQLRRYQEAGYSDEESRAWLRDQVSRDDAVPDPVRDGVATLCGVCGSQCPSGLSAHPRVCCTSR